MSIPIGTTTQYRKAATLRPDCTCTSTHAKCATCRAFFGLETPPSPRPTGAPPNRDHELCQARAAVVAAQHAKDAALRALKQDPTGYEAYRRCRQDLQKTQRRLRRLEARMAARLPPDTLSLRLQRQGVHSPRTQTICTTTAGFRKDER
jgi:hypothetical protein